MIRENYMYLYVCLFVETLSMYLYKSFAWFSIAQKTRVVCHTYTLFQLCLNAEESIC